LVAAIVSTPFLGFIIGSLVQYLWYFCFGQSQFNRPGRELRKKMIMEICRIEDSNIRNQIRHMSPLEVFCFFYYDVAHKELIDWSRRRRTAEMLGYNWTLAIIGGAILGWRVDGAWYIGKWQSILFLFWIIFHAIRVSNKARTEADKAEILWVNNLIDKEPLRPFLSKSDKVKVLLKQQQPDNGKEKVK
jgi:hypothetical protein